MKNINLLFSGLFLLCAALFTSCKKEGCTDSAATNFCKPCKTDDGTCTYDISGNWSGTVSGCATPSTWLMSVTQTGTDVNCNFSCTGCSPGTITAGGTLHGNQLSLFIASGWTVTLAATISGHSLSGTYICTGAPHCGIAASGTWEGTSP